MNKAVIYTFLLSCLFSAGCAHNIKITPDTPTPSVTSTKSSTAVGYFISSADKAKKTTTPGGGGDKVSYFLEKDMEFGIYSLLNDNYEVVKLLKSSQDAAELQAQGLTLSFEPTFTSTSSGSGLFTWPADKFSISINCKVYNSSGDLVLEKSFTGQGVAKDGEQLKNFSIAANRAATDVLSQLREEIKTNPALK